MLASISLCSAVNYTISGTVYQGGSPVGDAAVSARGILNTSITSPLGFFSLGNVPEGTVIVGALSDECTGNTTVALTQDLSGVSVELFCDCVPSTCEAANTRRCELFGGKPVWRTYDLTNATQLANYCNAGVCGNNDTIHCQQVSSCSNTDRQCLPGCSPLNDVDCICNSTARNGVCPSEFCDENTDLDCLPANAGCGDGVVYYPYETCEDSPLPGQFSLCPASSCSNCNCRTLSTCGNLFIDANEACEMGMVCADGRACLNCQCNLSCTGSYKNPTIDLNFDTSARQINVRWYLSPACGSTVRSYLVYQCNRSSGLDCTSISNFVMPDSRTFGPYENNASYYVLPNSEYSFFVKAVFSDNTESYSIIKKQATGDAFCMDRTTADQFCWTNNVRARCDANKNIAIIQDCARESKSCMGPDRDGLTQCVSQGVCDSCNGLYGLFSYLDLRVYVNDTIKYCHPGLNRDSVVGCYLEDTKTIFQAYDYCYKVSGCYDYKTEEGCLNDPCGKVHGCEWNWLNAERHEMGGICRPEDTALQNCQYCSNTAYNTITPICTQQACSLFGQCYYQGINSATPCSSNRVSYCGGYTTRDDCIGFGVGQPVVVNAVYDPSTGLRIGGTHRITRSDDRLGLGKCYWDQTNTRCFRDADARPVNFNSNTGFDCSQRDYACESDFTDPSTEILPSAFGVYPADVLLRYAVSDNYPSFNITTSFCAVALGGICYPDEAGVGGVYSTEISNSGHYSIFYYSQDPAKNLEIIKNITIRVDADPPGIDFIEPGNESEFPLNQAIIQFTGNTTRDAKWVCYNNSATRQVRCINNCALTGGVEPCFSDETGIFHMNITVGSSSVSNLIRSVVFFSEDFAGNTYANTWYGSLYHLDPIREPRITIVGQ